jgi:hypothetical protein
MKPSLTVFFSAVLLLIAALPNAFALQGDPAPPPPGNYSNRQLNPATTPPAAFGNDLVL